MSNASSRLNQVALNPLVDESTPFLAAALTALTIEYSPQRPSNEPCRKPLLGRGTIDQYSRASMIVRTRAVLLGSVGSSVSIGVGMGPRIGVQKGPLLRVVPVVHRWDPRVTRRAVTSDGAARVGGSCGPTGAIRGWGPGREFGVQARFLKRQLSFPVSTISQWWVRRSRSAVVILASPKTEGHSPKARLVVTITEVCS